MLTRRGMRSASWDTILFIRRAFTPAKQPPPHWEYRGRDGRWIHLHGGFRSREGTLALLGCADDADAIPSTVATWDAQALEDALAERGCCGVRLRSADEWWQHPQGIALHKVPQIEIFKIGDASSVPLRGPRAGESGARPLSGVRVLDLTRVLAGPTRARTMAEHGADVLHVRGRACRSSSRS